jgi:hypothetical protein
MGEPPTGRCSIGSPAACVATARSQGPIEATQADPKNPTRATQVLSTIFQTHPLEPFAFLHATPTHPTPILPPPVRAVGGEPGGHGQATWGQVPLAQLPTRPRPSKVRQPSTIYIHVLEHSLYWMRPVRAVGGEPGGHGRETWGQVLLTQLPTRPRNPTRPSKVRQPSTMYIHNAQ